ncbi:MAG: hypothetical protein J6A77_13285 [Lachnospiraceae bacterium]|nr:hypothetical protein [Lachnospiraceae bacterium]
MSASKSFIKNAVGLLIVVAICFVAVTIYKKGNASINSSISEYDEIISQFDNEKLKAYDNSTASGSQIIELLKTLKEEDGVTVVVSNGYVVKNKMEAEKYDYGDIAAKDSTVLSEIQDKTNASRYIKPNAFFTSTVVYDENQEISSIVFVQK